MAERAHDYPMSPAERQTVRKATQPYAQLAMRISAANKIRSGKFLPIEDRQKLQQIGAFAPHGPVVRAIKTFDKYTAIPSVASQLAQGFFSTPAILAEDVHHPLRNITGGGQMAWPGPNRLFPAREIPTQNPAWMIKRVSPGEKFLSLGVETEFQRRPGVGDSRALTDFMRTLDILRRQAEAQQATGDPRGTAQLSLLAAAERFQKQRRLDLAFNLEHQDVPGTPQASMDMSIYPDETYVHTVATRQGVGDRTSGFDWPPGGGYVEGGSLYPDIPPRVLMQFLKLALAPEKPINATVVNPKLWRNLKRWERLGRQGKRGMDPLDLSRVSGPHD